MEENTFGLNEDCTFIGETWWFRGKKIGMSYFVNIKIKLSFYLTKL